MIPDEVLYLEIDGLSYSLTIYDNFTTLNEEDLDTSCSQDYTLAWLMKAAGMVTTLNDGIAEGRFCQGEDGKLTVVTSTVTFLPQGKRVIR